jgi:hypothetical protein
MGVTLTYQPAQDVPAGTMFTILEEAASIAESRKWWCEPLYFLPGGLEGATKIFLPGYSTNDGRYVEVSIEDDSLMAAFDSSFILETLQDWAAKHGLEWIIGIDGDEVGAVTAEGPDPMLLGMVAAVATNGESDEMPEFDQARIAEIQDKYGDRF